MVDNDHLIWQYILKCKHDAVKNDIKNYCWVSDCDLLVIFKNNDLYLYDSFTGYSRKINYKKKELNEIEWKKEFSDRFKQLLNRYGISQKDLAQKLGLSQPTISNYLNGNTIPDFLTMNKILILFDCTINDILLIPYILKEYYKED